MHTDKELTWGGGLKGIFWGEHVFQLEPKIGGKTRLIHNEDFSGIAVGFSDLPTDLLTKGYVHTNEALKARAEALPL
jgi:hypothetical protein